MRGRLSGHFFLTPYRGPPSFLNPPKRIGSPYNIDVSVGIFWVYLARCNEKDRVKNEMTNKNE